MSMHESEIALRSEILKHTHDQRAYIGLGLALAREAIGALAINEDEKRLTEADRHMLSVNAVALNDMLALYVEGVDLDAAFPDGAPYNVWPQFGGDDARDR